MPQITLTIKRTSLVPLLLLMMNLMTLFLLDVVTVQLLLEREMVLFTHTNKDQTMLGLKLKKSLLPLYIN